MVSAAAATRMEGVARSLDEVADISRVDKLEIERTYRYLSRELGLTIPPTSPTEYLPRIASSVDCSKETERFARELLGEAINEGVHSGRDPVGIAASGLYAAGQLTNEDIKQSTISSIANK